jgi:hypothetical protein
LSIDVILSAQISAGNESQSFIEAVTGAVQGWHLAATARV